MFGALNATLGKWVGNAYRWAGLRTLNEGQGSRSWAVVRICECMQHITAALSEASGCSLLPLVDIQTSLTNCLCILRPRKQIDC